MRYLDIINGNWSGSGIEIENAFEYAKIVDMSPAATSPVPEWQQAAIVSEQNEVFSTTAAIARQAKFSV